MQDSKTMDYVVGGEGDWAGIWEKKALMSLLVGVLVLRLSTVWERSTLLSGGLAVAVT